MSSESSKSHSSQDAKLELVDDQIEIKQDIEFNLQEKEKLKLLPQTHNQQQDEEKEDQDLLELIEGKSKKDKDIVQNQQEVDENQQTDLNSQLRQLKEEEDQQKNESDSDSKEISGLNNENQNIFKNLQHLSDDSARNEEIKNEQEENLSEVIKEIQQQPKQNQEAENVIFSKKNVMQSQNQEILLQEDDQLESGQIQKRAINKDKITVDIINKFQDWDFQRFSFFEQHQQDLQIIYNNLLNIQQDSIQYFQVLLQFFQSKIQSFIQYCREPLPKAEANLKGNTVFQNCYEGLGEFLEEMDKQQINQKISIDKFSNDVDCEIVREILRMSQTFEHNCLAPQTLIVNTDKKISQMKEKLSKKYGKIDKIISNKIKKDLFKTLNSYNRLTRDISKEIKLFAREILGFWKLLIQIESEKVGFMQKKMINYQKWFYETYRYEDNDVEKFNSSVNSLQQLYSIGSIIDDKVIEKIIEQLKVDEIAMDELDLFFCQFNLDTIDISPLILNKFTLINEDLEEMLVQTMDNQFLYIPTNNYQDQAQISFSANTIRIIQTKTDTYQIIFRSAKQDYIYKSLLMYQDLQKNYQMKFKHFEDFDYFVKLIS